jgi:hypothetical protein
MTSSSTLLFVLVALAALTPVSSRAQSSVQSGSHLGKTLPERGPAHEDEHIVMPRFPRGWDQLSMEPGAVEIVEYAPKGQTLATWRDKITLEIHHDSNTLPLDAFQRRALAQVRENCDGVIEGKLQFGMNNGFPSGFWSLGCKKDKRGNFGEVRYTKAVQGQSTLYMLSRSWRVPAFNDETVPVDQAQVQDAVAFLASSVVCANAVQHPCPNEAAASK